MTGPGRLVLIPLKDVRRAVVRHALHAPRHQNGVDLPEHGHERDIVGRLMQQLAVEVLLLLRIGRAAILLSNRSPLAWCTRMPSAPRTQPASAMSCRARAGSYGYWTMAGSSCLRQGSLGETQALSAIGASPLVVAAAIVSRSIA